MAVLSMVLIVACAGSPAATPVADPTPTAPPSATATAAPTELIGTTPTPAGPSVDICALLSPDDLNQVTGDRYLEGLSDGFGQCYWDGDQMGGGDAGATVIGAIQATDLGAIKFAFGEGGVDVTVSGHAAFYNPTQGLGSLWVDLGDGTLFVLSFPQSNDLDPSYQAIAQQLAEIALSKM